MLDFLKVKSVIDQAAGAVRTAHAEAQRLKRQREDLEVAPVTKEDIIRLMLAQVTEAAAEYPAHLRKAIDHTTSRGQPSMSDVRGGKAHVGIFTARPHVGAAPSALDVQTSLCFILQSFVDAKGNSFLEAAIRRAVDAMPWPEGARPLEGREAALEELDTKIAQLEAEEAALRKAAANAGIVIS